MKVRSNRNKVETLRSELNEKGRLEPVRRGARALGLYYKSYNALLKTLGHHDGMAECIEIACRDLRDAALAAADPSVYLRERAVAQKISVMEYDIRAIPRHSAFLFIVAANQQLEAFLSQFNEEVSFYLDLHIPSRNDGQSPLHQVLSSLPGGLRKNRAAIWEERFHILEYYRRVRNRFVHDDLSAKIDRHYAVLEKIRCQVVAEYGLQAPNPYKSIDFDDFLLFTRLIKYLATDLVRLTLLNPDQIVSLAVRTHERGDRKFRALPFSSNDPDLLSKRLRKLLYGRYGLQLKERDPVLTEIEQHLRHLRRRPHG